MSGATTASVTYASAFGAHGAGGSGNGAASNNSGSTGSTGALMLNSWQEAMRKRWEERDRKERAYDEIIAQYQKLAKRSAMLQERNANLLSAAAAAGPAGSASAKAAATSGGGSAGAGAAAASAPSSPPSSAAAAGVSNPVQEAYAKSLEMQLATMRDELAGLYKTQSQNAQRLLVLNETLREREVSGSTQDAEVRLLREERERLSRAATDYKEALGEKDRTIQLLQDELNTLALELNQIEARNDELKRDNAGLLQRWLDRMNDEADRMNDANTYLEEVKRKRKDAGKKEGSAAEEAEATATATAAAAEPEPEQVVAEADKKA